MPKYSMWLMVVMITFQSMGCSSENYCNLKANDSVWYEAGAEDEASVVLSNLSTSIKHIENRTQRPFKNVGSIICILANSEHFEKSGGEPTWKGMTTKGKVYLSSIQEQKLSEEVLQHELAHLHISQYLDDFAQCKLESWLREGVADYISNYTYDVSMQYIKSNLFNIISLADFVKHNPANTRRIFVKDFFLYLDYNYDSVVEQYISYLETNPSWFELMDLEAYLLKHRGLKIDVAFMDYMKT